MKALLLLLILTSSCASYSDLSENLRSSYVSGDYQDALETLEERGDQSGSNRLLYHLEKSLILDRLGELKKSRKSLFEADRIADELYTTSITKTTASFVVNDSYADYSGEDYEIISIHTLLALSFLQEEKIKQAGVEARKINHKLHEISSQYDDKHKHYSEDAFARYLAGSIHEALGDADAAIVDYRHALKLYETPLYKNFYDGPVPKSLLYSLQSIAHKKNRNDILSQLQKNYQLKPKSMNETGTLVVFHEVGHITPKQQKQFVIHSGLDVLRLSFPYIPLQQSSWSKTGITYKNQEIKADNLGNLSSIAHHSLEDRRGRIILKSMARLLIKYRLAVEAKERFGPLAGLAANWLAAATETADTRSWSLLPAGFFATRMDLPPGEHTIKIYNDGKLDLQTVQIKRGKLKILRSQ